MAPPANTTADAPPDVNTVADSLETLSLHVRPFTALPLVVGTQEALDALEQLGKQLDILEKNVDRQRSCFDACLNALKHANNSLTR